MKLNFATNNNHKLKEVQEVLGDSFQIESLHELGIHEDIPENQQTLEGNALQKARFLYQKTGESCFADDTGLEVEALNGAPGVYSARYAGESKNSLDNMALLLKNMEGKQNRKARFRTVIALILDGKEYLFEGIVNGVITEQPRGTAGFGYDPLFVPDGFATTFAEMDSESKNAISHRGLAVEKLAAFLLKR